MSPRSLYLLETKASNATMSFGQETAKATVPLERLASGGPEDI